MDLVKILTILRKERKSANKPSSKGEGAYNSIAQQETTFLKKELISFI